MLIPAFKLLSFLGLGALGFGLPASSAPAFSAARPNVVLILADDLGWGDPRCYNPACRIPTPNLDRLAAQGMLFWDAHTPAAPSPCRMGLPPALLPGRNPTTAYCSTRSRPQHRAWAGANDA